MWSKRNDREKKPNCYKCKYRGGMAGSYHSCCEHPSANADKNPLGEIMGILASVGRVAPVTEKKSAINLNIKGNSHGINSGWFNWPYNFDPVWLENCDGFEIEPTESQ